ncbi:MAG: DASH family cryptochrome [Candidatus Kapabacteria bacterium]|nr:DASH family cryptochrome [Candidatus Kapabacteria bacterium]
MTHTIINVSANLRLDDHPAFAKACASSATLLAVVDLDPTWFTPTALGFPRIGPHRAAVMLQAIAAFRSRLTSMGSDLLVRIGPATIDARRRRAEASMLLHVDDLPFSAANAPSVFTAMRQRIERAGVRPRLPVDAPVYVPPPPSDVQFVPTPTLADLGVETMPPDPRSSFPYQTMGWGGGEDDALANVADYFASERPHTYKQTRNGLAGTDYSSKWSTWLAHGSISPRRIMHMLTDFEQRNGANDSTYWLWFELLWRDFFRMTERAEEIDVRALRPTASFEAWRTGRTGQPFVDAAMRELAATGYTSNRMRQIAASYAVHDLGIDWRLGEAWFASMLVDYDPWSNTGNWKYVAGVAHDPKGGRRFDPIKQAEMYDSDGAYRALWSTP